MQKKKKREQNLTNIFNLPEKIGDPSRDWAENGLKRVWMKLPRHFFRYKKEKKKRWSGKNAHELPRMQYHFSNCFCISARVRYAHARTRYQQRGERERQKGNFKVRLARSKRMSVVGNRRSRQWVG